MPKPKPQIMYCLKHEQAGFMHDILSEYKGDIENHLKLKIQAIQKDPMYDKENAKKIISYYKVVKVEVKEI